MKQEGVTQQRFAEMLGISASSLSSIMNGRTQPTANHVLAIHKVFPNISLNWLMCGEGEMYAQEVSKPAEGEPDLFTNVSIATNNPVAEAPVAVAPQIIREIVYKDKPPRQITEIRIFFDDGTFETYGGKN